ncbi:MAG: hypothetical protein C9356_15750 [Oleiphilus sp.]|nr:MAG: hypothetical protein C9356_15750 [Oleiphilus sp.]
MVWVISVLLVYSPISSSVHADSYYDYSDPPRGGGVYNDGSNLPDGGGSYWDGDLPSAGGSYFSTSDIAAPGGSYFDTSTLESRFADDDAFRSYNRGGTNQANDFFNEAVAPGMKTPDASGDTSFRYRQFNYQQGTNQSVTINTATDIHYSDDPGALESLKDSTADLANDPGEINSQTADLIASNPEYYDTANVGIASSTHPDYYNDPIMVHSRDVFANLSNEVGESNCTVTKQFTSTETDAHVEDIRICQTYVTPPTCTLNRFITSVEKLNLCEVSDIEQNDFVYRYTAEKGLGTTYLPGDSWTRMRIRPICTNVNVIDDGEVGTFYLRLSNWRFGNDDKVRKIPVDNDPNWKTVDWGSSWIYTNDLGRSGRLKYRNHACDVDADGEYTGYCSIEFAMEFRNDVTNARAICGIFGCMDSDGETWDEKNASGDLANYVRDDNQGRPFTYYRSRLQYTVHEDFTYDPPGCNTDPGCEIKADPLWEPIEASILDSTSSNTWQCQDATNDYIYNDIQIDPTDPTLFGIYWNADPLLNTRIEGPAPMFPGDRDDLVCYKAKARNYDCGFGNQDGGGGGVTLPVDLANGSTRDVPLDQDFYEQAAQGCDVLDEDPSCVLLSEQAIDFTSTGRPLVFEKTFDCGFDYTVIDTDVESSMSCVTDTPCVGNDCMDTWEETNPDFIPVAVAASANSEAKFDSECLSGDPGDCSLFGGKQLGCKQAMKGWVDCCNNGMAVGMAQYAQAAFAIHDMLEQAGIYQNASTMASSALSAANASLVEATGFDIAGSWKQVSTGAENLYDDAASSVSEAMAELSEPFVSAWESMFVEEAATEVTADAAASYAAPDSMLSAASASIEGAIVAADRWVAEQIINVMGPDNAAYIVYVPPPPPPDAVGPPEPPTVSGGPMMSALSTAMTIYAVYQMVDMALHMIYACEPEEMEYEKKNSGQVCAGGNTYCADEWGNSCIEEWRTACCFETKLARLIQEAAERQNVRPSFGTGPNMECRALTLNEIKAIDWDDIEHEEWLEVLTVSGRLPNGLEDAENFMSLENMTRDTYMTQDAMDAEKATREEAAEQRDATLAKATQDLARTESKIAQLNDQIAAWQARKAAEEAKAPMERDMELIADLENKIALAVADRDIAIEDRGILNTKINNLNNMQISDYSVQVPEQSTTIQRLQNRIGEGTTGQTLSEIKELLRMKVWHPPDS